MVWSGFILTSTYSPLLHFILSMCEVWFLAANWTSIFSCLKQTLGQLWAHAVYRGHLSCLSSGSERGWTAGANNQPWRLTPPTGTPFLGHLFTRKESHISGSQLRNQAWLCPLAVLTGQSANKGLAGQFRGKKIEKFSCLHEAPAYRNSAQYARREMQQETYLKYSHQESDSVLSWKDITSLIFSD